MYKITPLGVAITLCFLYFTESSCSKAVNQKEESPLFSFLDTTNNLSGYKDINGKIVIPEGKYVFCFTDTFKHYAIVANHSGKFIGINRVEKQLYEVFNFDNGPDYPSEGLFRVISEGKMGYADIATGKIVIPPQFDCAYPFEGGEAKVSIGCKSVADGEHTTWTGGDWFTIDKKGNKLTPKK